MRVSHIPGDSDGKVSAGDLGLIPGLGTSLGEGHGNPLQYSSTLVWKIPWLAFNQPESSCCLRSFLWDTDKSSHTLNYWEPSNLK